MVTVVPTPMARVGPPRVPPCQVVLASRSAPLAVLRPLVKVRGLKVTSCLTLMAGTVMAPVPVVSTGRQAKSLDVGEAPVDQLALSAQLTLPAPPVQISLAPETGQAPTAGTVPVGAEVALDDP